MSQPPGPWVSPEFQPPPGYGGYGGPAPGYGQQPYPDSSYSVLPPPPAYVQPLPPVPAPPQRPAGVGLAVTLAATASLQWVCVLSFCWLVATAGVAQLGTSGMDGGLYHALSRFSYRMLDGLAWPLYLFPLTSFVLSFLLLVRRPWTRLAFSATGAAALLWSAWWLRDALVWWFVPAVYIAVSVLVLWTREGNRWFGRPARSDPAGQPGQPVHRLV